MLHRSRPRGGGRRTRRVALAVGLATAGLGVPASAFAGPVPDGFYGVAPQDIPSASDLERMAKGKVDTVRFQIRWSAIDPTPFPGDYDWRESDGAVANAARNGIRAFPFVYSTPPWVATMLDDYSCDEDECAYYPPRSSAALAQWELFVSQLARRYGPGGAFWRQHPRLPESPIRDWEIWNEQNNADFFRPKPGVRRYARLLDGAAQALRGHDPGARIVLGGMFEPGPENENTRTISALGFLADLYDSRARRDFDIVATHPYAAKLKGVRVQLEAFRKVMRQAGRGRDPLWITELGWSSARARHPLYLGPKGQARRVRRLLGMLTQRERELRVGRLVWFSWRDSRLTLCGWCKRAGLFHEHGLRPKPSWRAFTKFTGGR